jgi:hypothetical protein
VDLNWDAWGNRTLRPPVGRPSGGKFPDNAFGSPAAFGGPRQHLQDVLDVFVRNSQERFCLETGGMARGFAGRRPDVTVILHLSIVSNEAGFSSRNTLREIPGIFVGNGSTLTDELFLTGHLIALEEVAALSWQSGSVFRRRFWRGNNMALDIQAIIRQLREELNRVNQAIAAIEQLHGVGNTVVKTPHRRGVEQGAQHKSEAAGGKSWGWAVMVSRGRLR